MRESLLHFVWKFQKFDQAQLTTTSGQILNVLKTGQHNLDAGPDFSEAKIEIDGIVWYGHVEIHVKSSDWNRHGHHLDQAYNNVILHVVYEDDQRIKMENGQEVPTLILSGKIGAETIQKGQHLLNNPDPVSCSDQLSAVNKIHVSSMIEQAAIHRLEKKSEMIVKFLQHNRGSWEETAFQWLARSFGFKVNADAFDKLAKSVSHKILAKHAQNLNQLEALLFGLSGFLPSDAEDDYTDHLKQEFKFLTKKYSLNDLAMLRVEWKFLRMRPANFPTVRLSQFAAFVHLNEKFFHDFIHFTEVKDIKRMFNIQLSDYWSKHYDFGKPSAKRLRGIGQSSIDVILINTVAPLLVAYGRMTNNERYTEKATDLLASVKSEQNRIIYQWTEYGVSVRNAVDSQGLISLYNDFCLKKRCLSCKIGCNILMR